MSGANDRSLAAVLRSHQERIMLAWEQGVRSRLEAAAAPDRVALRDHLPKFLTRLADALDPAEPIENAAANTAISDIHGKERAQLLQYTITQVLHEYSILRNIVFETLEASGPLEKRDRAIILRSFDTAARDAAQAFMEEREEREREKRLLAESERDRTQNQVARLEADRDLQKTFVATMTHDLRNPIASVKMALELLINEFTPTPETESLVEVMNRNLERSQNMLHDLLDADRVKSGNKLPLNIEPCNLTRLAKTILAEMLAVHGQSCVLNAEDDIRGYWCLDRLRRVMGNLLDNAFKYGARGPVTLTLEQGGAATTIAVHNVGPPIPPEVLAVMFEPHFQAKPSKGPQPQGWGLGLTLVHAVAEAHHGKVRVESEVGKGTTFFVTLPNDCRVYQA